MKYCPTCNISLEKSFVAGVEVDNCPRCYGLFFEEYELAQAKDARDRDLRWLDIELWRDPEHFHVASGKKMCPADRMPMYEVRYGDSSIRVDVCNVCRGVWLDRGEFKDIIGYLRKEANEKVLHHYLHTVSEELWEVFSGPEILREELLDFIAVVKLMQYKFAAQHPALTQLIVSLPK
ncbi:MAG: zf-TFIIB domain-containing protein [Patescibacteria group bacterium]|nr:zf-TFIIB domain-containing protein [Patescibacteria group bacterium]